MLATLSNRVSPFVRMLWGKLFTGKTPYVFTTLWVVLTSVMVYFDPRALPAFLLFLSSVGILYVLPMNWRFKLGMALVIALLIVPVIGMRNIFYLEVIFQISIFAALALGLNIVVGFTGLLNLGYVAFYAVGAYLWGIFGSQQLLLLHAIPGRLRRTSPSSCPPTHSTCLFSSGWAWLPWSAFC